MCSKKESDQEGDDEEFDGKSDLVNNRQVGLPKMQEMVLFC